MKKFLLILLACIVVYHIGEYIYIRHQVQNLCKKEAGVFIYVTPEQWREENTDKLKNIVKYKYDEGKELARKLDKMEIDNLLYKPNQVYTSRTTFYFTEEKVNKFTSKYSEILVDNETKQVLLKYSRFSTGVGKWFQGTASSYKFWMNEVPNCGDLFLHDFIEIGSKYNQFN